MTLEKEQNPTGTMPNLKPGAPAAVLMPCRISSKDISAMDYWLNESPMSDPSRQNAICFALKRMLAEDAEILLCDRPGGGYEAVVNDSIALPLPSELAKWWQKVLVGHRAVPVSALIEVPVDLLAPGLLESMLEKGKKAPVYAWPAELPQANAA